MTRHESHPATPTAGTGRIRVAPGPRTSVVTRAYASSPLKWLMPRNRGGAAWIFASSYGGGLVGGDHLDVAVAVEARASALLSTQSATKIYRSRVGAGTTLAVDVDEQASFVHLPDPTVCFAGSTYQQHQTFRLASTASLVSVDWMTSGRLGHGERWAFDQYVATTHVEVDRRLVLFDRLRLCRSDGDVAARQGRFDVLAAVVIVGTALATQVKTVLGEVAASHTERRPAMVTSAAPIGDAGCVVRLAGMRLEDVSRAVQRLLRFVPAQLGDDPWSRKW